MILIVTGSRYGREDVEETLEQWYADYEVKWQITGGARGVDTQAFEYAQLSQIRCTSVPALWGGRNKQAGFQRNNAMMDMALALAKYYDTEVYVLAFPDGNSPGTRDMMKVGENWGARVVVAKR
jgi:hypothetical protein